MRESNFSNPQLNRACVSITSAVYDRRAIDSTSTLPLINSLTHLAYLTSTSPRIREMVTLDGGLERLVQILQRVPLPPSPSRPATTQLIRSIWKWSLAFQCAVNIGVRGSENVRIRVVDAGMVPITVNVLESYLAALDQQLAPERTTRLAEKQQAQAAAAAAVQAGLAAAAAAMPYLGANAHSTAHPHRRQHQHRHQSQSATSDLQPSQSDDDSGVPSTAFSMDDDSSQPQSLNQQTPATASTVASSSSSRRNALHAVDPLLPNSSTTTSTTTTAERSHPRTRSIRHRHASSSASTSALRSNTGTTIAPISSTSQQRDSSVDSSEPSHVRVPDEDIERPRSAQQSHHPQDGEDDAADHLHTPAATLRSRRHHRHHDQEHQQPTTDVDSEMGELPESSAEPDVDLSPATAGLGMGITSSNYYDYDFNRWMPTGLGVGVGVGVGGPLPTEEEGGNGSSSSNAGISSHRRNSNRNHHHARQQAAANLVQAVRQHHQDDAVTLMIDARGHPVGPTSASMRMEMEMELDDGGLLDGPGANAAGQDATAQNNQNGSAAPPYSALPAGLRAQASVTATAADMTGTETARPDRSEARMGRTLSTSSRNTATQAQENAGGLAVEATAEPPSTAAGGTFSASRPLPSIIYREEEVLLSLQLLAYVSKYPHVRELFHSPEVVDGRMPDWYSIVASAAVSTNGGNSSFSSEKDEEEAAMATAELLEMYAARSESWSPSGPARRTVFSIAERFTLKPSSTRSAVTKDSRLSVEIQYWAGVIMRNACRKDESRGGVRQCANMLCGKWEGFPREFAKCRRCRKAKYCSKQCQSKGWAMGHRHWCNSAKEDADHDEALLGKGGVKESSAAVGAGAATAGTSSPVVVVSDPMGDAHGAGSSSVSEMNSPSVGHHSAAGDDAVMSGSGGGGGGSSPSRDADAGTAATATPLAMDVDSYF
ncbi:hypothetical protein A4X09_0g3499 [Tilletia walkeri]|uniref:MYND-type domain-containing protein n=1 Tax=Tilletia walkeri TaxID=117179 RepID=A0A8X7T4V1_9BASI|nr:hypothetical protein A4X09_0g3499 [Tilletia walkeri]